MTNDLVVIGSGPAGLAAAIYAARLGPQFVVIEGPLKGGRIINTSIIENYPGLGQLDGSTLMEKFYNQAKDFGTKFLSSQVTNIEFGDPFRVFTNNEEIATKSIILATGSTNRRLQLPLEEDLIGRGISFCATCDGMFMRGKTAYVVGGGDTALHEAIHLSHFAKEVVIVHRRDAFRASKYMQEAILKKQIKVIWNATVSKYFANESGLTEIELTFKDGHLETKQLDGLFLSIGSIPNVEFLNNQVELLNGHIKIDHNFQTNIPGVFAAGDVADPIYKQVVVAAGQGAAAAIQAGLYLSRN